MTTVYPFSIQIGPLQVTGFGIMMMVGFLMGGWIIDRDLRARGFNRDYTGDIVFAAVIGGVVGAKLWYVALHGLDTLFSRSGLVWYGGLLGGAVAVAIQGARRRVPFRWTAQLVGPALPAAHALGRVGCFMVGDDYGRVTSGWWGVKFPQGLPPTTAAGLADLGWQAPAGTDPTTVFAVHPTQLYEVALLTIVFMVLWTVRNRHPGTGWVFGLYLVLAGAERFAIEFLRLKDDRFFGPLTLAQVTSAVLVAVGFWTMARLRQAGPVDPGPYLEGRREAAR
jgi:phosphatidylglycerol:prolipoprotein diacylglycerol transferase